MDKLVFSRRAVMAGFAAGCAAIAIEMPLLAQGAAAFPFKFSGFIGQQLRAPALAIPSYQLSFFTAHQSTAVGSIEARSRLTVTLAGVDEADMKALTEEAFSDLKTQLAAAGFTPLPSAEVRAAIEVSGAAYAPGNRDFKGIGGGITIGKSVRKAYVAFGAKEAPLIEDLNSVVPGNSLGVIGGLGKLNQLSGPAKKLKALMIAPSLVIDFANSDAKTGSDFLGRKKAIASSDVGFAVVSSSKVGLMTPSSDGRFTTPGSMALTKDYRVTTPFATVAVGEGKVRALSVKSVVDANYSINDTARGDVIEVDPVVWKGLVRDAYQAFNAGIVAQLVKSKK
jgi:hypothetical protein